MGRKRASIEPLAGTPTEKFYESSILVKAENDLTGSVVSSLDVDRVVAPAMGAANIRAPLKLSGMIFDFDNKDFLGKRKPFRLVIDRRINVPFSENIFYSQAPFRTDDHLDVLTQFERAALIK